MIRKAITDTFHTLIHENFKFNGSAELLDILASIISGFAVPLRDEHVVFYKSVIIPLHKVIFYFKKYLLLFKAYSICKYINNYIYILYNLLGSNLSFFS